VILSVAGVQFSYPSRLVLQGVSFQLERGQILGVLGVNGAGKSTLLKCINKILRPAQGSVFLAGNDILQMKGTEVAKRLGYVPQKYGEELLTVFDTVLLGRKPHIKWAARERDYKVVEKILQLMHLEEFALRPVNELSGGETQKVMIARALAQEPDVMLLDEPLSNLDLKNQLDVMSLITRTVKGQGLSAILSIHDLNVALRFADFFLLLKNGRVHTFGDKSTITPEVIYEVYGVHVILKEVQGYTIMIIVDGFKESGERGAECRST
jgi:iron complex transport system ATP-binding protein